MAQLTEWKVPPANQPRPGDYSFDLDRVLASVVGLHSIIPPDAFSADSLGTERAGNGVRDRRRAGADHRLSDHRGRSRSGCILATAAWWRAMRSASIPTTGFGLVQALGRIDLDPLPLGSSADGPDRRPRGGRRRRRAHPVGRQPHRRQAGIRRLLGVSAGRGDLHLSRPSQLGRHRTDLEPRRTDRHRLAPARARARGQAPSMST